MTVSSTQSHIEYAGDGSTKVFSIPFRFLQNGDISVMVADSDGNISTPTNGADFSVSGAGGDGGVVTFNTAYPSGYNILLYRDPPATQETKYYENGKFPAASHEAALDKLTMLIQERGWKFDSLALKRPSVFASYYDAEQNRIANVAPPEDGADAINKNYADAIGSGASSYTDQQLAKEAQIREAADNLETNARAEADANIQRQLTGEVPLEASAFSVISWHDQTVDSSIEIPANKNAWSFGEQLGISPGQVVTIGENSSWTVANGRAVEDADLHNVIADQITTSDGSKVVQVASLASESEITSLQAQVDALGDRVTTEESKVNDIAHGGTGANTKDGARTSLGAAASGANSDITSLQKVTSITGVKDGSSAAAGSIGEVIEANGTATALTSGTAKSLVSINLTPGDWDVSATMLHEPSGATISTWVGSINNNATAIADFPNRVHQSVSITGYNSVVVPQRRINISANTTFYLTTFVNFGTSGTVNGTGYIRARRAR
ncbi:hypothetical protein AAGQ96_12760 [Pantoea sp. MBD-2R]|uniref:hypothetical protein n=1 Tax=Pantoea sp. MBD-2R TaxID=3141540 RepID=UPI0031836E95